MGIKMTRLLEFNPLIYNMSRCKIFVLSDIRSKLAILKFIIEDWE